MSTNATRARAQARRRAFEVWLPYAFGTLLVGFSSLMMHRACLHGTVNYPHVGRGTRRYVYCFQTLPTHPWLVVLLPSAVLLLAGALVIRTHRYAAWVLIGVLAAGLFAYVSYVNDMNGNLTI